MSLILDVRIDGFDEPIGALVRADNGNLGFAYDDRYIRAPDAMPLSLSMPPTDEPYRDAICRAFFGNLLQERDGPLQRVMEREGLERSDIAGLLYHLGADCPGAISILPQGAPPAKVPGDYKTDYQIIDNARLQRMIAAMQARQSLPDDAADPSPLAGVQSKIAITRLPTGELAEPKPNSGAPTTHILKVPDSAHRADALHENAAMRLVGSSGFEVAETAVIEQGGIEALLVTRFDRELDHEGRIVRLHQEDFAQALGLPPSLKYERNGTPGRRFDVSAIRTVLNATSVPAQAVESFIDATFTDLLVGNVDGHAKNFALLHRQGAKPMLAPRYDILPTRLDPSLTTHFAYSIGRAKTFDQLIAEDVYLFLAELGITTSKAQRRIAVDRAHNIGARLLAGLSDLDRAGLKRFADLVAANVGDLFSMLGIPVPGQIADRDAFIGQGGGWALGS